ncbi:MAG: DUF935 domain-containing protein [Chitinophagales bacterium]|nr:DUF935 domain-containing protein [Chitinophagales bacterium]
MATRKKTAIEKALPLDTPERFRMGEMGNLGLKVFNGVTNAELKRELNFPNNIQTYKEMSYHPAINAPLTLFENIISKATWTVVPPKDATEEEKNRCRIIESMMHDMDQPWEEFIKDSLSSLRYGFAVHEKVYRKRYTSNGSLFNDGIVGWKKLPIRAQESIDRFVFSEDGNEIIGVKQNLSRLNDSFGRYANRASNEVVIPRSKFLLFRTGNHRGDPYGVSPLRDAYLAWKFLTAMEDMEATGVAKDLQGLPVLSLPAQYMAADAPPEVVALRQYYENFMRNLQVGEQSAVMLPMIYDEVSKQPLFKLELLSVDGKKNFDIAKIKEYYKALIFTSLFSGILTLGDTSTGSFALGSIKNSISGSYAYKLLKEVTTMLNRDLIRQTYILNGWDTSRMGTLDFDGLEESDLETFSKAVQRMGATGYLPKTIDVVNTVLDSLGMDALPEGTNLEDVLPDPTSKSGEGMKSPFEGTRTSQGAGNDNDSNLENVA